MNSRRAAPEIQALLPWVASGFLWVLVLPPLRSDEAARLGEQSTLRRERVKADRAARDAQSLKARLSAALSHACRASSEPAALRQRTVAATAGLALSPLSLSVTGGSGGGATVEATATREAALALVQRLGDPARGGFLRSFSLREKGAVASVSVATGVLDFVPQGLPPEQGFPSCGEDKEPLNPTPAQPENALRPRSRANRTADPPSVTPPRIQPTPATSPEGSSAPPFTVLAFVSSENKTRVSIRSGGEIRIVSVGDQVDAWRCLSIDRDAGVAFVSASGERVTLRPSR